MQADIEFLGLAEGGAPGRSRFTVGGHLARLDGKLYGGTAIAASIATAELLTERTALWMTTQFIATAPPGAEIDVHTEVLAGGRRTNQVRVTGTDAEGRVMFASLGATGHHRPDGLTAELERAPVVQPPADSEPWSSPFVGLARFAGVDVAPPPLPEIGFTSVLELRHPEVLHHPDPGPGRFCLWMRRKDRQPVTAAVAAYMADMVPLSIAHAAEVVAGGTSLDNTIRIGAFTPGEWILLDLRPHLAVGDYGHGVAHVWSEDGHLLATASQTASMIHFDLSALGGL